MPSRCRPLLIVEIKNRAQSQPCKIHANRARPQPEFHGFRSTTFSISARSGKLSGWSPHSFSKKREEGRSPPLSVRSEFCWDRILFNVAGADHVVGFSVVALGQLRIVHLEVDAEGPSKSQPLFRSDLIHPEIHYVRPLNLLNFEHVESFSFERGEVGEPEPFRLPVFSL